MHAMQCDAMRRDAMRSDVMRSDVMRSDVMRSDVMRPLRSYFPTRCIRGGPTSPIVRIYSPASVY